MSSVSWVFVSCHFLHCSTFTSMPRKTGDLELTDILRGRIVSLLESETMSQRQVASRVGRSQFTVRRLWNQWQTHGHCDNNARSGRLRLTNERIIRITVIRKRFASYRRLASCLPFPISRRTLNRWGLQMGYRAFRSMKCVPLTPGQQYLRLKWCRERQHENLSYWRRIIFSDESRFTIEWADGRIRVKRRTNDRYLQECVVEHQKHGVGSYWI